MTFTKFLIGGAGLAALATAAPSAGQYYGYGYNPYNSYGNSGYGGYSSYGYMNTSAAASQCTAAVQSRLYNRSSSGLGILGTLLGANTYSNARVLSVTRVTPTAYGVTVRGLATSGRMAYNGYGAYGIGAYGALGYSYRPDLSFRCDVDPRGFIRDVDIHRR